MTYLFFGLISILIITMGWLIIKKENSLVYLTSLLVFFLPFTRIPTVEVMGYTLKINHIIGLVLILAWIFYQIKHKIKFTFTPVIIILSLLILSQIASVMVAPLQLRASIFLLTNIFTIVLAVIVADIVRKKEDLRLIEKAVFASLGIVLLWSFWQFFGDLLGVETNLTGLAHNYTKIIFGFPRVQAFSKEPLYLGNFLFIPLGFLSAKLLSKNNFNKALLFLLYLIVVVFILTLSRGALLSLVVFALVLIALNSNKLLKIKPLATIIIICVLAFLSVFLIIRQVGPSTGQSFISHLLIQDYGKSDSTVSRLSNNSIAIKDWENHPLIGIGLGNFGASKDNFNPNGRHLSNIVNNEYLEVLAETGIVGFVIFLTLIITILLKSLRAIRLAQEIKSDLLPLISALTATFVAIFAQYLFFSTLSIIYIWVLIGLLVAVQNMVMKDYNNLKNTND